MFWIHLFAFAPQVIMSFIAYFVGKDSGRVSGWDEATGWLNYWYTLNAMLLTYVVGDLWALIAWFATIE